MMFEQVIEMKKLAVFVLAIVTALTFAGCSKTEETTTKVYSFRGENEVCSVNNGVIVISPTADVFYGGNLEGVEGEFTDLVSCTTTFYVLVDGEKENLFSNVAVDQSGGTLSFDQEIGQISGEHFIKDKSTALENNLYFELETTDKNGTTNNYQIPMDVVEVTKDISR